MCNMRNIQTRQIAHRRSTFAWPPATLAHSELRKRFGSNATSTARSSQSSSTPSPNKHTNTHEPKSTNICVCKCGDITYSCVRVCVCSQFEYVCVCQFTCGGRGSRMVMARRFNNNSKRKRRQRRAAVAWYVAGVDVWLGVRVCLFAVANVAVRRP